MDAMILAAGLGTRLGGITRDTPKALVDVGGLTPLDRIARRLVDAGADHIIINVHHHADQLIEHVQSRDGYGVRVSFSREPDAPLETGGGVLHAAPLFRLDAPFFLHNVDVLTTADLSALYQAHVASGALATLAVNHRDTSRYLVFDERGLCGRLRRPEPGAADAGAVEGGAANAMDGPARAAGTATEAGAGRLCFAFAGIHVVSPALPGLLRERGAFSIIDAYLRLAAAGERIAYHDITGAEWLEIGTPERLEAARRALA
jgi:N-acetyl-alpha-D-muramate 1-phosphate uridylyltransferase